MARIEILSAAVLILVSNVWLLAEPADPKPVRPKTAEVKPTDPPATTPAFLVQPYLQLPTQTSIRVMWETNQKLPTRVEFGRTRELDNLAELPGTRVLHEVPILGLQPAASYYYRVRSGELVSDVYTFSTAPPLGTSRWRMALYGDSRSNPAVHHRLAQQIAKAKVDLILHTGDIVSDGTDHDSWRKQFFEPLDPVAHTTPWVSTIGNHEKDSKNYFSYMALPGNKHHFGFDYANAHIICLDSNGWMAKDGRDIEQNRWLKEELKARRGATWTFAAFHHPLFSAHASRGINSLRWDWAPLFLDPESRVDGVFSGHDHFYARNYRMGRVSDQPQQGVLFMTSAGGGASIYPTKKYDYVATEKRWHHFTLFEFEGDKVNISAVAQDGEVFDRYVLTKSATPPEEFCAYEIEELRKFLRQALGSAKLSDLTSEKETKVKTTLHVPTRFRVPVSGQLQWQAIAGWKIKHPTANFQLQPGQPLDISIEADVTAGAFGSGPPLTITFDAGKFRNRVIELNPFKPGAKVE